MNRTNFECALPSKATEHRRTPRRWGVGHSRPNFRQVLECAAAAALWISQAGSWSQCTTSKSWRFSNTCQLRLRSSRAGAPITESFVVSNPFMGQNHRGWSYGPSRVPLVPVCRAADTRPTGKRFMFPTLYRNPICLFQFPSWEGLGMGSGSRCTPKMAWRLSMHRAPSSHPFPQWGRRCPKGG